MPPCRPCPAAHRVLRAAPSLAGRTDGWTDGQAAARRGLRAGPEALCPGRRCVHCCARPLLSVFVSNRWGEDTFLVSLLSSVAITGCL